MRGAGLWNRFCQVCRALVNGGRSAKLRQASPTKKKAPAQGRGFDLG
jgi:hypothetical protein